MFNVENDFVSKFNADGFVLINSLLSSGDCDDINSEIDLALKTESNLSKNPNIYHYNESPRVIEAWKWSERIRNVALNARLNSILSALYGAEPIPFSTINFVKGTEQPLHSDYFHFGSVPAFFLAGAWLALEDISSGTGELTVVPGSHLFGAVDCGTIGCKMPKSKADIKTNNTIYEEYVAEQVKSSGLTSRKILMNKGDVIIWAANLLHGGSPITKPILTRRSMVVHYHFEGCSKFYNPNFSDLKLGKIAERNIDRHDIRNSSNYFSR